ncbi:MAG TPA: extracellular solute-binding protein [Baekduia sp.]|nr:extracellular solute-binding protein [Baekduia sp.]
MVGICVTLAACGGGSSQERRTDTTCDGRINGTKHVTAWFHASSDVGAEPATLRKQVAAFNASQRQVRVRLITLPEGDYSNQIRSAVATGNLPDVLDFDGPSLYNYAWSGKLKPIDSCISKRERADLLPSILQQGSYAGRMWGVGTFDSGLGLYVRPSILARAGIRIPRGPDDAWTAAEFAAILHKLQQMGYRRPLDLQMDPQPLEWNTYGFAPAVWSAGGDLIDRTNYRRVAGVLNGAPAVKVLSIIRGWAQAGYTDPSGNGFARGKAPIAWVGHWMFDPYTKAFPRDVTIVPLPNFGRRTVTGMGSWQWGITANATDGDAAWRFLAFLLRPGEVVRMTRANGSIPATKSAIRRSPRFAPGGPEHLYITQLESGVARPRPQTPAYPALSEAFSRAFQAIVLQRRPVKPELDAAARRAARDVDSHQYYKTTRP